MKQGGGAWAGAVLFDTRLYWAPASRIGGLWRPDSRIVDPRHGRERGGILIDETILQNKKESSCLGKATA